MEEPSAKKKRGPYRRYLTDLTCPVPRTTRWRNQSKENEAADKISEGSETSDNDQDHGSYPDWDDCPPISPSISQESSSEHMQSNSDQELEMSSPDTSLLSSTSGDSIHYDFPSDDSTCTEELEFRSTAVTDDEIMNRSIYPGASVTVLGAYCSILEFKRVCKLSFSTIVMLLKLLQVLCPTGNLLPTTKYQLMKFANKNKSEHIKVDFCRSCQLEIPEGRVCSNSTCKKEEPNSLIQISSLKPLEQVVSKNWAKIRSHALSKQNVLGVIFNTDGVDPFKSSKMKIWPIYITLINLPAKIRMLRCNIVTCALWVGNGKPPFKTFMESLVQIFQKLNLTGLRVRTLSGTRLFTFKPLYGVFDLIAKAPIMNMHQHNGRYGCPCCLHPGIHSGTMLYPPRTEYPLRTHDSINEAAIQAEEECSIVEGIKGKSILSQIVDLPVGAPIDYMHCVLEGVVKRLLERWFSSSSHGKFYYLNKPKQEKIDSDLINQRPPHDFSRAPRSIREHKNIWKANEFRAWLLYYSLPLLLGTLPPLYLHHYALLVCAMHILLQPNLTRRKIDAAEEILKDFVNFLPELYSETECTLNAHLLLHICDHARHWGPLWGFSAFGFESMNGCLVGHIHATYRVASQLLFSLDLNQTLNYYHDRLLKTETEKTLQFLSLDTVQANLSEELCTGTYAVGRMYSTSPTTAEKRVIELITTECPDNVTTFERVYHRETLFVSTQFGRPGGKRDSTICTFVDGEREKYGSIQKFYIVNSIPIAIVKQFLPSGSLLQAAGVPGRTKLQEYSSIDLLSSFIIRVTNNTHPLTAVRLESIVSKCICVEQSSSEYKYVVKIPNNFECH